MNLRLWETETYFKGRDRSSLQRKTNKQKRHGGSDNVQGLVGVKRQRVQLTPFHGPLLSSIEVSEHHTTKGSFTGRWE